MRKVKEGEEEGEEEEEKKGGGRRRRDILDLSALQFHSLATTVGSVSYCFC
jgi:hypothetical protein